MSFQGRVWKFGDDVNTDEIIPARFLNRIEPAELAKHLMEGIDPEFSSRVRSGDIIVAGKNFGCGSSREHAPVAIKAAGIACVIAREFARIFYRNAFNMGLLILESSDAVDGIDEGDTVLVNPESGIITNVATGLTFRCAPIPPFMRELVEDGGLIPHIKKKSRTGGPKQS